MALTQDLSLVDNFQEQIQFVNCYIRVTAVACSKSGCVATYSFFRDAESSMITDKRCDFSLDLEGPNPIKQAYLHLKTLPEFADAIDC